MTRAYLLLTLDVSVLPPAIVSVTLGDADEAEAWLRGMLSQFTFPWLEVK